MLLCMSTLSSDKKMVNTGERYRAGVGDGEREKEEGKENEKEKEKREESLEVQKGTGEEMEQ